MENFEWRKEQPTLEGIMEQLERRKLVLQREVNGMSAALEELRKTRNLAGTSNFTGIPAQDFPPLNERGLERVVLDNARRKVQNKATQRGHDMVTYKQRPGASENASLIQDILYRKVLRSAPKRRFSTSEVMALAKKNGIKNVYKDDASFRSAIFYQLQRMAERGTIRTYKPSITSEGTYWQVA